MSFSFEVSFDELQSDLDAYVNAVFGCLESDFLVMPKGEGFVEFPVFEYGYEALKRGTRQRSIIGGTRRALFHVALRTSSWPPLCGTSRLYQ